MESIKCVVCGEELKGNQRKFCSVKCTRAYYRLAKKGIRLCPECGELIPGANITFCSQECAMAWRRRNKLPLEMRESPLETQKIVPIKPLLSWEEMGKLMRETGLSYGELTAQMDGYKR